MWLNVTVEPDYDDGYSAKYKYIKPPAFPDCCLSMRDATHYTNAKPVANRLGPSFTNVLSDRLVSSIVNAMSPLFPTKMDFNQASRPGGMQTTTLLRH